jgi:uncharacterized surface protein with fasciclin (FAS1) repeats
MARLVEGEVASMARLFQFGAGTRFRRSLKYTALIVLAGLHLFYIVILFSSYTVRRDLETDVAKLGADQSLDSLVMLSSMGGETVRKIREYRCLQRDAIAFYRIATMDLRRDISEVYRHTLALRQELRGFIATQPMLNRQESEKSFDNAWGVPLAGDLVFQTSATPEQRQKTLEEFRAKLDGQFTAFKADTKHHTAVIELLDAKKKAIETPEQLRAAANRQQQYEQELFDLTAVGTLETALAKMNKDMASAGLKDAKRLNILIRKVSAEESLGRGDPQASYLSEIANQLDTSGQSAPLRDLDCTKLDEALTDKIVAGMAAKRDDKLGDREKALIKEYVAARARDDTLPVLSQVGTFLQDVHRPITQAFIAFPTSAQTLIVTMLFGSLGALSLQALRLSNRGYWGTVSDPSWGEIVISMWLGMTGAIIVYLLASIGLLVVSDGRSNAAEVSTVGASLVALLGFVSGLLNDEAFARIRRFGLQFFQDGTAKAAEGAASGPNAELAQRLLDAGCSRFAELARIHCLGTTLQPKDHFTLFAPANATFDGRPLSEWSALADPKRNAPFTSFASARLVDTATLTAADLGTLPQLAMADGSTVPLERTGADVRLRGERIELGQPYKWRNGAIFVTRP